MLTLLCHTQDITVHVQVHHAFKPIWYCGLTVWLQLPGPTGLLRIYPAHNFEKRSSCKAGCIFLSITTPRKWLVSLSEFDPFSLITFENSQATQFIYFIPIQVSGGPKWKLAGSTGRSLWCACCVHTGALRACTVCIHPGNFFTAASGFFFLLNAPLRNFHRNERKPAFNTLSSSLNTSMVTRHARYVWTLSKIKSGAE